MLCSRASVTIVSHKKKVERNRENNVWTNQKVLGVRLVFRGVIFKSWVVLPLERIKFSKHNKILVREEVELHSTHWKKRCNVLHSPEHEKISLNKEIKQIKDEAETREKVNHERHVNLHHINENTASIRGMRLWIKKAR